jgi:hypothetical protein
MVSAFPAPPSSRASEAKPSGPGIQRKERRRPIITQKRKCGVFDDSNAGSRIASAFRLSVRDDG